MSVTPVRAWQETTAEILSASHEGQTTRRRSRNRGCYRRRRGMRKVGFLRPNNRRRSHRANLSQCTILVTLVSSLLFLAACSGISVPASSSSSNPTGVVVTVSPATVRSSRADLPKGHRSLARQDLLNRPLNPFDFFADYSDRLLVFRWVGQRSDCFQSASYLMTPSPNEVEPSTPLLAISVNASDEPSGEPGKHQTKQHLNRNTIGYAVKL